MSTPQLVTEAIILTRVEYGEADRIITMLTPEQGKLRLIAKGVRRVKSKLAGSIELFSVTNITYIRGRSEIGTLISARLTIHYGHIVQSLDRTMLGYELIKRLNKVTEDEPEPDYFHLLQHAFSALDDPAISTDLIKLWFDAQLLRLGGHMPNLQTEPDGTRLEAGKSYEFSFDDSSFISRPGAPYDTDTIKYLRLVFSGNEPHVLSKVEGWTAFVNTCLPLVANLRQLHLRVS